MVRSVRYDPEFLFLFPLCTYFAEGLVGVFAERKKNMDLSKVGIPLGTRNTRRVNEKKKREICNVLRSFTKSNFDFATKVDVFSAHMIMT